MERLLDAALRAGAHGLSTGLVYPPGCYASTDELVRLCRVVGRHQAIYTSHVRGERETILEAVAEALDIARECGVAVEVSHNAPKWGAPEHAGANLALIEEARRGGLDATTDNDVHPELAPRLSRALPQPLLDLDRPALLRLLADRAERDNLRRAVAEDALPGAGYTGLLRHGRFDRIVILHAERHPELRGRSVADIAAERGRDGFDTFLDLIVEEDDRVVGIFDYIAQDDIETLLRHPLAMVCSDGLVMPPAEDLDGTSLYWPCSYGEYPGILERYVRDKPVLRLEEAVRKDDLLPRAALRLARPRRAAPGVERRHRRLRSRQGARPGHQPVSARVPVREHPPSAPRRPRLGVRQRPAGDRRRRAHGGLARARAAAPLTSAAGGPERTKRPSPMRPALSRCIWP